jgi:hypothetical protein
MNFMKKQFLSEYVMNKNHENSSLKKQHVFIFIYDNCELFHQIYWKGFFVFTSSLPANTTRLQYYND